MLSTRILLLIMLATALQSCHAQFPPQGWSNLAETDYKGPVRMVVKMHYPAIHHTDTGWVPDAPGKPSYTTWTYYNAAGLLDSIITRVPLKDPTDTLTMRAIAAFDGQGARNGTQSYYRGKPTSTCRITWLDAHNYVDTFTTPTGELDQVMQVTLADDFFQTSIRCIVAGPDQSDVTDSMVRDAAGYTTHTSSRDALSGDVHTTSYQYARFDAYRNPLETLVIRDGGTVPQGLVRREMLYWPEH